MTDVLLLIIAFELFWVLILLSNLRLNIRIENDKEATEWEEQWKVTKL